MFAANPRKGINHILRFERAVSWARLDDGDPVEIAEGGF
jgi:hypothetical protein